MSILPLLQAEARAVYFTDFGEGVTYTPAHGPGFPDVPVQIVGVPKVLETGKLSDEGDRERYHKMADLLLSQCDGTFQQGDKFEFRGQTWKFDGSPSTPSDGTQVVCVISYETYEIGHFRRVF